MRDKPDFFKLNTGKTYEDIRRERPKAEDIVARQLKQLHSNYPLRLLGTSQDGNLYISEEEREANYHIIGASGEGKSKFLELSIRQDIDAGNGLCLLDPTDFGKTCYDILRYCAKIGHKKVLLIDPDTLTKYGKIASLKPLQQKYVKNSVAGIMETVNILFGTKETETPRIKRYLSALLRLLAQTDNTLYETLYFSDFNDNRKDLILNRKHNRDTQTLKSVLKSEYNFGQFFSSTVNRLELFWEEPLSLMLGSDDGIDFVKMISEGWVILVNLSPNMRVTPIDNQVLGVLIIAQIIQAIDILRDNGWQGIHYLYMDEAARFATPQIEQLLSYKRKSGLRLIIAHHYFNQFENRQVLNSIKQNARIKVMFNTPSHDDRLEMVKALGYGGDIPPMLASYANQDLPKQYAIVKKNKEKPVRIKIPDVESVEGSQADVDKYIKTLLEADWYNSRETIIKQRETRLYARGIPKNPKSSKPRKASHRKSDSKTSVPDGIRKRQQQQSVPKDNEKPKETPPDEPIKI